MGGPDIAANERHESSPLKQVQDMTSFVIHYCIVTHIKITIQSLYCHPMPYCDHNTDSPFLFYYFCYIHILILLNMDILILLKLKSIYMNDILIF